MDLKLVSDIEGEHKLRVSENIVRRRILGSKTNDIIKGWKKMHGEKLDEFCSS
jgi:hypothetical protein